MGGIVSLCKLHIVCKCCVFCWADLPMITGTCTHSQWSEGGKNPLILILVYSVAEHALLQWGSGNVRYNVTTKHHTGTRGKCNILCLWLSAMRGCWLGRLKSSSGKTVPGWVAGMDRPTRNTFSNFESLKTAEV